MLGPPERITIPLVYNQSLVATPVVSLDQHVFRGQKIAEGIVPIFSSISGTVSAIGVYPHPVEGIAPGIVIDSDGRDDCVADMGMERTEAEIESLTSEELLDIFRETGLMDLTKDSMPVFEKIQKDSGKKVKAIVLNGAEDEPYLTSDYLLMFTKQVEILRGLEWMIKACGADEGWIAISENKMDCYEIFASKLFSMRNSKIRLARLKGDYPLGYDFQILSQIFKKTDPENTEQKLIFNVATALEVFEAVKYRKPFMDRVVTVAGICLMQPQNVLARIGASFNEVISEIGGFLRFPNRVIMGGPMRGVGQSSLEVPVIAETSGILAFPKEENSLRESSPCIRCGDCIPVCPVSLNPVLIMDAAMHSDWNSAKDFYSEACIECGNCSYVCPSKIPVMQWVKEANKNLIQLGAQ